MTDTLPSSRRDLLLDAARAEFVEHGIQRVGVADIAQRAKVSRQTLYRQCGDMDAIITAVIVRETLQFSSTVAGEMSTADTPAERLIEAFVAGMRECRSNPLVRALKDYDLQSLVEKLMDSDGSGQRAARTAMAILLSGPGLPFPAAERAIEFSLRVTATLLLSPTPLLPTDTDDNARRFATAYLAPSIDAALSMLDVNEPG